jgi:hypothetical protein
MFCKIVVELSDLQLLRERLRESGLFTSDEIETILQRAVNAVVRVEFERQAPVAL